MSITGTEKRLQRLSKLSKVEVNLLAEGVSLESTLSRSIEDISMQVAADRLALASDFLRMADHMRRARTDLSRSSIARYYYAMYHAMRAVAFVAHGGDDFEAHSTLFKAGIPADFPNRAAAGNDLRNARLLRNEADYEPYPANSSYFQSAEKTTQSVAHAFVTAARAYLATKGNPYV